MSARVDVDVATVTLNPAIDQTLSIPNFAAGSVNRVAAQQSHAGGKGLNVATVLADYGLRTAASGLLGADNDSLFVEHLAQYHIHDGFIRLDGVTRTGLKITNPVTQETTDINFPGLTATPEALRAVEAQLDSYRARWIVLGGSLPPGAEKTIYRDWIVRCRQRGMKVALDASDEALRFGIEAMPALIKPNLSELETLTGIKLATLKEVIATARSLVASGIELVVVSMGADGACFVTENEAVVATPPKVEVRSTVGAGDAMVAGTIAGLLEELPLSRVAALATAFSVEAVRRLGAGLSSKETVQTLASQVAIRPVS